MKKTLIAMMALCSVAMADYTWTGSDVTAENSADAWKASENWDGITMGGTGNGPMTSGSNMWEKVIISNGSSITLSPSISIEGWNPVIEVTGGSSLTIGKMVKIQPRDIGAFTVGTNSTLVIQNVSDSFKDGNMAFSVDGTLDINFNGHNQTNEKVTTLTLGADADVTFRNIGYTGAALKIVTSLGTSTSSDITLLSRELMTLDNVTLTNVTYDMGEGWVQSSAPLTATAENVGKFYIAQEGNKLKAYYVMPEPATATLSLLALAGLAARRRRH